MSATPVQTPPNFGAAGSSWKEFVRRIDWTTFGFILFVKTFLFAFVFVAFKSLSNKPCDWLQIWNRWDTVHYINIARDGYVGGGEEILSLAFYPLYPWLIRLGALVTGNYFVSGILISTIASIVAGLLLQALVRRDESGQVARLAVWFLFIFPTSYFLHIAYTESLFLALTLGCILAARAGRWEVAGILGAAASLTRFNGLILIPVAAAEAWQQYRVSGRWNARWLWLLFFPLGFVNYLCLNYSATGDFFFFSKLLDAAWLKHLDFPWVGLRRLWETAQAMDPEHSVMAGFQELFFAVLALVCTIWSWRRLRLSYAIWMTLNSLLFVSTSKLVSTPRYVLTLFPMFILFGRRLGWTSHLVRLPDHLVAHVSGRLRAQVQFQSLGLLRTGDEK